MKDRDAFISENMGLVGMIANRYRRATQNNPMLDYEDLVSMGSEGLIKACDRFDPAFGTQFSTYAVLIIENEIRRFLRDHNSLIKLPRSRQYLTKISQAGLIGEKPDVISEKLNIPLIGVKNALKYYKYKTCDYLDRVIYEDGGTPVTLADTIGAELDMDSKMMAEQTLSQFDERTQRIIKFRLQGLTQMEIAKIIGVSQTQISRILISAREKLKAKQEYERAS